VWRKQAILESRHEVGVAAQGIRLQRNISTGLTFDRCCRKTFFEERLSNIDPR
jgi:hypothetical protein